MSGLLAEFAGSEALGAAVRRMHALGYRGLETYAPFPVPGLDRELGARRSRIPLAVLVAGVAGGVLAYLVQWGTILDYPLRVAGFPAQSLPAFIPIIFETVVLAAAATAFIAVLASAGLPRWWHPYDEVEGFGRATIDRYFLAVSGFPPGDAGAPDPGRRRRDLESCQPLRVVEVEAQP